MTQPHSLREMDLAASETNAILDIRCPCCDSEPMTTAQTEYKVDHFGSEIKFGQYASDTSDLVFG